MPVPGANARGRPSVEDQGHDYGVVLSLKVLHPGKKTFTFLELFFGGVNIFRLSELKLFLYLIYVSLYKCKKTLWKNVMPTFGNNRRFV